MRYRPLITPQPPAEADLDTPEMAEAVAFVEAGEGHLAMLETLAAYGMELAKAQADYAKARLAAVTAAGAALNPGEDPTAAFDKIAQTVRRIIALQVSLTDSVNKRRAGLEADRAAGRAKRAKDHEIAVKDEIEIALAGVHHADLVLPPFDPEADPFTPEAYEIERREMLLDAERLLDDLDDCRGWLTRPVGETVAKLCAALGLPADACVKQGETWLVRRPDTAYETILKEKSFLPPPRGEGQAPTGPP